MQQGEEKDKREGREKGGEKRRGGLFLELFSRLFGCRERQYGPNPRLVTPAATLTQKPGDTKTQASVLKAAKCKKK